VVCAVQLSEVYENVFVNILFNGVFIMLYESRYLTF
jgi:hypothetical protein